MLNVGITGGIGSGKTTICKIFETIGIPIYYADDRAKKLMVTDIFLIENIKKIFGEKAYFSNGELNRAHLSALAFSDKNKIAQLNALVHPAVHADSQAWFSAQQGVPYALKEAALHFESGGHKHLDKMIMVFAPQPLRVQRVRQRDNKTEEEVLARMKNQMAEEEKVKLSDFVIRNDEKTALIPQVLTIHQTLLTFKK